MFKTIKNALKTPDVRKRILYTLLLIVIFRLGCYITVPGVNSITLNEAMSSNNGVAGLDLGVLPIGDWSIAMILSNWSNPSMSLCSPGFVLALFSSFARRLYKI